MPDYFRHTWREAVLRSGVDGGQETTHASQPGLSDEHPGAPAVAPSDAHVDPTPVRPTEQEARTLEQAAVPPSEHDRAQDSPSTSLPVIHDKC